MNLAARDGLVEPGQRLLERPAEMLPAGDWSEGACYAGIVWSRSMVKVLRSRAVFGFSVLRRRKLEAPTLSRSMLLLPLCQ